MSQRHVIEELCSPACAGRKPGTPGGLAARAVVRDALREAGLDPFELYRKADAMLYLSKDLGRDQCHFWDSEGQHLRLVPRPS